MERIMKLATEGVADPSKGSYRADWVRVLELGFVPHSYLVKKSNLSGKKFKSAMGVLIGGSDLSIVPDDDPLFRDELKGTKGKTPVYYVLEV